MSGVAGGCIRAISSTSAAPAVWTRGRNAAPWRHPLRDTVPLHTTRRPGLLWAGQTGPASRRTRGHSDSRGASLRTHGKLLLGTANDARRRLSAAWRGVRSPGDRPDTDCHGAQATGPVSSRGRTVGTRSESTGRRTVAASTTSRGRTHQQNGQLNTSIDIKSFTPKWSWGWNLDLGIALGLETMASVSASRGMECGYGVSPSPQGEGIWGGASALFPEFFFIF